MVIVQNPITGRSKKKFGTAVFTTQFGKNVMRTKPLEVKNPKTEGQVRQRNKFSTTVDLVRNVLPLINEIYAGSLRKMSPFNKVTSLIVKNAFSGDPPVLDHTKVTLCNFEGSSIKGVTLLAQPNQEMDISWDTGTINQEELDSNISFVLFNCSSNKAVIYRDVAPRSDGNATIVAPEYWVGDMTALHVLTIDVNQRVSNKHMKLIKFKAGADASSVVQ